MRSRKTTTKRNLFFQYYAIVFSMVWGILLVPLYLIYIPLEIYGGWLATGNIVAWLTIIDPGISDVLRQQTGKAYGAGQTLKLNDLLGSGTLLSLIVSILVIIVGLVLTNFIVDLIKVQDPNNLTILKNAFMLAVAGTSLMIFSFGFTSFNQGLLSSLGIGLVYVVATITSLIINVTLLLSGFGLYALPIGQISMALILILGNIAYIFWRFMQESLKFSFSIKGFLALTKLTGYNILGRLGNVLSTQIDTLLVARYLGAEVAPILSLTKKGPELSRMFVERPSIAMLPALTNAWEGGEFDAVSRNTSRLFIIILWLLGLIFTGFILLNNSFVSLWVGGNLFAGNTINIVLCLSMIFSVIVGIISNIFFALGNIKQTSKINFIQSLITVTALFVGVKYYGLLGMVIAQAASILVFSAWYFPYKAVKFIKYDKSLLKQIQKECIIVAIISVALIFIFIKMISVTNWVSFFIFGLTLVVTYWIALSVFSKSFRNEMSVIIKYFKMRFEL